MSPLRFKLRELAEIVGGEVDGDANVEIGGVAGIREARTGDITFLANPQYEAFVETTSASAVICPRDFESDKPLVRAENPYLAFLKVLSVFAEVLTVKYPKGIHPQAVVDERATFGENVAVGPFCQVCAGVHIGDNSTILAGTFVGEGVVIGGDCLVYPNVTIREGCQIGERVIIQPGAVIGADGFGYAKDGQTHCKVPQVGRVIIEDDVEIGANSTVDRATTGETRIKRGSKIDNLVQIAHNVTVGEDCVIAAQTGISGSTDLGKNVVIAGQVGIVGHITIGDNAMLGAQSGVTKSVPPDTAFSGYPAREHSKARRILALTNKLPDLLDRIKELERKLEGLEEGKPFGSAAKDNK